MDKLNLGMSSMGKLLKGKKLRKSDFTINRPQTLFGPDFELAKAEMRCIHCGNKYYPMPSKPGYLICKSKKHKGGKVISLKKLNELSSG